MADSASNEAAAQADAVALLAAAPLPAGAMRSATEPAGDGSVLAQAAETPSATNLVDDAGWWILPDGTDVVSYIAAHRPPGTKITTTGSGGGPDVPASQFEAISWPAIPGVLSSRDLVVHEVTLEDGSTAVRLDAEVVWLTARLPSEQIPAGMQSLTVTALDMHSKVLQGPLVVTARMQIAGAASVLNALPVAQSGFTSCPPDSGTRIRLAFHQRAGSPPAAVANIDPAGCHLVNLSIAGRSQPVLSGETVRPALVDQLNSALGLQLKTGPRRPFTERIPAGARRLTVTTVDVNSKALQGPLIVTAPKKVARVASLLNALPSAESALYGCSREYYTHIRLAFYHRKGAPQLAVADVDPSGCHGVGLSLAGLPQPELTDLGVPGPGIVSRLEGALGVQLKTGLPAA